MIDLRSDTVTLPSPAMLQAMVTAELGDDVYGDDPTVKKLEAMAAERMGKQAAVFVASGTMGNLSALLSHCGRGDEALIGDEAHIYHYEAGGGSALGGVVYHLIPTRPDGTLPVEHLAAAVRQSYDAHQSPTKLICLENTHNRCGGVVLPLDYMRQVREVADAHKLRIHLDGARIFNASVALGIEASEITQYVDSVTFCLSKGLSAPVGSVLCGDSDFIGRARRIRKMLGGGMRQVGVLAAAGIVGLEHMVKRLAEDHANARILAEGLAAFPQLHVDLARVQTDIIYFTLVDDAPDADEFLAGLREHGILMGAMGKRHIRAVTHYGISTHDIEETLEGIRHILR